MTQHVSDTRIATSFRFQEHAVGPQSSEQTLNIMMYELGSLARCHHYNNCYGPKAGYLANRMVELSDLVSMCRYYAELEGYNFQEVLRVGEMHYMERMEDLRKYGVQNASSANIADNVT